MDSVELMKVPNFFRTLTRRVQKAGVKDITLKNVEELEDIYQIGPKRISNIKAYLRWQKRNGRYLVEKTEDYDIYCRLNACIINFNIDTSKVKFYRCIMVKSSVNSVSGVLKYISHKGNKCGLTFGGSRKGAIWRERKVNGIRQPAPLTLSNSLREGLQRIVEVGLTRLGERLSV